MNTIQTTVVGSYPLPAWLAAYPTSGNLRDAPCSRRAKSDAIGAILGRPLATRFEASALAALGGC